MLNSTVAFQLGSGGFNSSQKLKVCTMKTNFGKTHLPKQMKGMRVTKNLQTHSKMPKLRQNQLKKYL